MKSQGGTGKFYCESEQSLLGENCVSQEADIVMLIFGLLASHSVVSKDQETNIRAHHGQKRLMDLINN